MIIITKLMIIVSTIFYYFSVIAYGVIASRGGARAWHAMV